MKMRIAILTPNPFPVGNVATNRFTTYAKAVAAAGVFVKVYVLKATEVLGCVNNTYVRGHFQGVNYEYMSKTTIWDLGANKIIKLWQYVRGIATALQRIRADKITCVILYTNDPIYILIFGLYSKLFSLRIFIDKSEYPVVYRRRWSLYKVLYLKTFKLVDGVIVMTNELMSYYMTLISKKSSCFLLPMSVDTTRFSNGTIYTKNDVYYAAVFGTHNRDNILDTIKSFALFRENNPYSEAKLYLIGDFDNLIAKELIMEYLECHKIIRPFIHFTGNIVASSIPDLLAGATILLTTPREYASGGFPTKLGEYLATGNPVVATAVGEIPFYLTHMKNCLLSEPGDIKGIARNLQALACDSDLRRDIGRSGQELALTVFNACSYVPAFVKFIESASSVID
jgi:glycosyltransferase involved in cell wall biosynthesis